MYEYWAWCTRVIDGDTAVFDVDLGFKTWTNKQHFRIAGISALGLSELGGKESKLNLVDLLYSAKVKIQSVKLEYDPAEVMSFARYVVNVFAPSERVNADKHLEFYSVADYLIETGWAVPWDGKSRPVPKPKWPRDGS